MVAVLPEDEDVEARAKTEDDGADVVKGANGGKICWF